MMKKLYLEPTSMCNLNCRTCFRNNWFDEKQGIMSDEILQKIYSYIKESNNLQSVMLAGMGEPLLHEKTAEIVNQISSSGKKAEVLTNGTLLDEKMSAELIGAGLDTLWVSCDEAHIESANSSAEILRSIEYFNSIRKNKCKLGFTFVVENACTDKIYEFAEKFHADEVNISGAIPSSPVKDICSLNTIFGEDDALHKNYCPFIEEEKCFVKWNGDVSPCMQLLHSSYTYLFEEKRKVTAYSFGNLSKNSLEEIWNSKKYREFREKVKNFEFPDCTLCDGCDDRLENKTDCIFNEMPTCGACLWAQNIARCP